MRTIAWTMILLLPVAAQAHPGHVHDAGLIAGAGHPFTGLDHLLGLLAAGMLMGWLPRAVRWPVCGAFLGLLGATHLWWLTPGAGAPYLAGLLATSALLLAASMAAGRLASRRLTAAPTR